MKIIDDIKLNRSLKDLELYLCENNKKQPVLILKSQNSDKTIHLKRFFGKSQYRKWLCEAVLLHLLLGDSYKKEISRIYKCFQKTLEDNNEKAIL